MAGLLSLQSLTGGSILRPCWELTGCPGDGEGLSGELVFQPTAWEKPVLRPEQVFLSQERGRGRG